MPSYKIPSEVEYTVTPFGDGYTNDVRVTLKSASGYAEFSSRESAQKQADEGSVAAKAAVLFYAEQEDAKWKFGDEVTPDNHPSKPFWFVDSDPVDMALYNSRYDQPGGAFGPYRFVGFVK